MVEVGQISIKAKVDTTTLDSGTKKVKSRFKEMDASGKMSENSFNKIGSTLGTIGGKLAMMGTAGITAIGGLASKAPALAGAFARMKVTTGELARSLGQSLAPTFDFLSEKYQGLANWTKEHPIITKTAFDASIIALAVGGIAKIGSKAIIAGKNIAKIGGKLKLLKPAFANVGIWGAATFTAVAAATAGWFASKGMTWLLDKSGLVDKDDTSQSADIKRTAAGGAGGALAGAGAGALTGVAIGAMGGPIGAGAGALIGGAIGLGVGVYQSISSNVDSQNAYDTNMLSQYQMNTGNEKVPDFNPYNINRYNAEMAYQEKN